MTYALDTNTISFFLRGEGNVDYYFQKEIIEAGNLYVIPFIVKYEIRRWLIDKPTKAVINFAMHFELLFESVQNEAEISNDIWDKAADIYVALKQKGQLIGDADILIAAFCIEKNCTLVTRNTKHFVNIDDLSIVNWADS